ncbi:MAG: hypothetical protein K5769_07935 [Pseudobutyrivibrio sp.]|nr:hypothetical protein [Pseudobutyrivibrio sp.]
MPSIKEKISNWNKKRILNKINKYLDSLRNPVSAKKSSLKYMDRRMNKLSNRLRQNSNAVIGQNLNNVSEQDIQEAVDKRILMDRIKYLGSHVKVKEDKIDALLKQYKTVYKIEKLIKKIGSEQIDNDLFKGKKTTIENEYKALNQEKNFLKMEHNRLLNLYICYESNKEEIQFENKALEVNDIKYLEKYLDELQISPNNRNNGIHQEIARRTIIDNKNGGIENTAPPLSTSKNVDENTEVNSEISNPEIFAGNYEIITTEYLEYNNATYNNGPRPFDQPSTPKSNESVVSLNQSVSQKSSG